jgi:hypothetical protein
VIIAAEPTQFLLTLMIFYGKISIFPQTSQFVVKGMYKCSVILILAYILKSLQFVPQLSATLKNHHQKLPLAQCLEFCGESINVC